MAMGTCSARTLDVVGARDIAVNRGMFGGGDYVSRKDPRVEWISHGQGIIELKCQHQPWRCALMALDVRDVGYTWRRHAGLINIPPFAAMVPDRYFRSESHLPLSLIYGTNFVSPSKVQWGHERTVPSGLSSKLRRLGNEPVRLCQVLVRPCAPALRAGLRAHLWDAAETHPNPLIFR